MSQPVVITGCELIIAPITDVSALIVEQWLILRVIEQHSSYRFVSQGVVHIEIRSQHPHLDGDLMHIDVELFRAVNIMADGITSAKRQQSSVMQTLISEESVRLFAQARPKLFKLAGILLPISLALLKRALPLRITTTVITGPEFFREIFHRIGNTEQALRMNLARTWIIDCDHNNKHTIR